MHEQCSVQIFCSFAATAGQGYIKKPQHENNGMRRRTAKRFERIRQSDITQYTHYKNNKVTKIRIKQRKFK